MTVITRTAGLVDDLIKAHQNKSLSPDQIEKTAVKIIGEANSGREAVVTYYKLFPTVVKFGNVCLNLSGTVITLPVIFKMALCIDSKWFNAFFNGAFADSKRLTLNEIDPVIFELFKDHFYKNVPLKSFEEKIELIRFCNEYEFPKQAKILIKAILLDFELLDEHQEEILLEISHEINDEQLGFCILYLKCMHVDSEKVMRVSQKISVEQFKCLSNLCNYFDELLNYDRLCLILEYCLKMELRDECEYLSQYMAKRIASLNQAQIVKTYLFAKKHNLDTMLKALDFHCARISSDEPLAAYNYLNFLPIRSLFVHCKAHDDLDTLLLKLAQKFPNIEYLEIFTYRNEAFYSEDTYAIFKNLKTVYFRSNLPSLLTVSNKLFCTSFAQRKNTDDFLECLLNPAYDRDKTPTLGHILYLISVASTDLGLKVIPYISTEEERLAVSPYLENYGYIIKPGYLAQF